MANSGYGTRSEVKSLIRLGKVRLNGELLTDPGCHIEPEHLDQITVEGSAAELHENVHLLMHKPAGLITALEDKKLPTIAGIIPERWQNVGLFPVGRLDRDTTGLLLLTNDGDLCHRLTSPRWEIWKTYRVGTRGRPFEPQDVLDFAAGLSLPDGMKCQPAKLEILGDFEAFLTIHEGKYHQVKRMMLGTGRRVRTLHRVSTGPLLLDEQLKPGQTRLLTRDEIRELYESVQLLPRY